MKYTHKTTGEVFYSNQKLLKKKKILEKDITATMIFAKDITGQDKFIMIGYTKEGDIVPTFEYEITEGNLPEGAVNDIRTNQVTESPERTDSGTSSGEDQSRTEGSSGEAGAEPSSSGSDPQSSNV